LIEGRTIIPGSGIEYDVRCPLYT